MRRWCLSVLTAAVAWGWSAAHAELSVVDDRGTRVTLPGPARRVVTLLPSLTETVCVLGACQRLVATDRWSNWPASVRRLPKAGGLDDPAVEQIVGQRPDLVLLAPSSRLATRLRGLGLTVAEFDAQDLDQVHAVMTRVAILLGRPQSAAPVWQALRDEIGAARVALHLTTRPRVYVEVSSAPYAAGEASYIGQLLDMLGVGNVVPAAMGAFPRLNPEFIVRADPDLIVVSAADAATLSRRPGWSALRALRQGQVCKVPPHEHDLLSRPGPRLGQAARVLVRCLAPLSAAVGTPR